MIEWVKALHVISVIAWMAGMLYLPRLFVYHTAAEKGSVQFTDFTPGISRLSPAMPMTSRRNTSACSTRCRLC